MKKFTLSKPERLSSEKEIGKLFTEGQNLTVYPIRLIWRESVPESIQEFPLQVMFSVSKKSFAKAVDRNRIKRLMREGFRLLKPDLYESLQSAKTFHLALIYIGDQLPDFITIQKTLATALERWMKKSRKG